MSSLSNYPGITIQFISGVRLVAGVDRNSNLNTFVPVSCGSQKLYNERELSKVFTEQDLIKHTQDISLGDPKLG